MKSKRTIKWKWLAAASVALAGLAATTSASANDVYWSIGVSSPGVQVGVQNAPPVQYRPVVVYQQPQLVYQYPQVVYQQPQVIYVRPQPVYVQPQPIYYTQPAPVYYGPPQVIYQGGQHRGQHGWHQSHHGRGHYGGTPQGAVRISGHGQSNDRGRSHH